MYHYRHKTGFFESSSLLYASLFVPVNGGAAYRSAPPLKKTRFFTVNGKMKALICLVPLWVALFAFTALSFYAGPAGVSARRQLAAEREKQEENIRALQRINRQLTGEKDALASDPQTLHARARELGYGAPDERFVRIVGLSRPVRPVYEAGQTAAVRMPDYLPSPAIRLIAMLAGSLVFIFLLFFSVLRSLVHGA
jgi:cell division protein FtsB